MNKAKIIHAKNKALITAYTAVIIGMVRTGATIPEIKHVTGLAAADIEKVIIENKLSVKPTEAPTKTQIVVSPVIQALARLLHTLSIDDQRDLPDRIKEGKQAIKFYGHAGPQGGFDDLLPHSQKSHP